MGNHQHKPLLDLVRAFGSHRAFGLFLAHQDSMDSKGPWHLALADLAEGLWLEFHDVPTCGLRPRQVVLPP